MIFREGIGIFSQAGTLSGKDLEGLLEKAKKLDMNEIRKEIKAKPSQ
jgi:thioredoxin 1